MDKESRDKEPPAPCRLGALAPWRRLGASGPYAWRIRRPGAACKPPCVAWKPPWRPAPPGSRLGALGQHLCSSAGPYAWRRRAAFHFCAAGRNKGGRSALLFAKPWSSTCTAPVQVLRRSAVAQQKR